LSVCLSVDLLNYKIKGVHDKVNDVNQETLEFLQFILLPSYYIIIGNESEIETSLKRKQRNAAQNDFGEVKLKVVSAT